MSLDRWTVALLVTDADIDQTAGAEFDEAPVALALKM